MIYKLMLNRMPDENTNPVGTTQTSQNDQTTTNQTGNEFTIDFGGGENKDETTSEGVELSLGEVNNENKLGDSEPEIDLGFNDDAQETESQENNNISIQDLDSLFNENQNNESNNLLEDVKHNEIENNIGTKEENNDNKEENITSNEENKIEDDQELVEETDNQEFSISLDDEDENNEIQDNQSQQENKVEDDQSPFNEEKIGDIKQDIEEKGEEGSPDFNDNQEENIENNNFLESVEAKEMGNDQAIEESVLNQGDEFSISFDDNVNLSENSDKILDDNTVSEEINTSSEIDINNEIQTTEEKPEESEIVNGEISDDEEIDDEETLFEDEDTAEVDLNNNTEENDINNTQTLQEDSGESKLDINLGEDVQNSEVLANDEGTLELDLNNNTEENDINNTQTPQEDSGESKLDINLGEDVQNSEVLANDENPAEITNNENPAEIANDENPAEITNNENLKEENITENQSDNPKISNNEENSQQSTNEESAGKGQNLKDLDFAMDFNLDGNETSLQGIKQPEIGDLVKDIPILGELINVDDLTKSGGGNLSNPTVENGNNTINELDTKQSVNSNTQDFTLDYADNQENKGENQNVNMNANISQNNDSSQSTGSTEVKPAYNLDSMAISNDDNPQQPLVEKNDKEQDLPQNQVNNYSESMDSQNNKEDLVVNQTEIATLSLDQILDSELNSNPQYADNSRAVPKNVPLNSGFFNKKTVGIMVGVLILACFVAVWAFPSKKSEVKTGETDLYTGSEIEGQEHYSGDEPQELTEDYLKEQQGTEINSQDDNKATAGAEVITYPDDGESRQEGDSQDQTVGKDENRNPTIIEPEPYTCMGEECEEEIESRVVNLTLEEIEPTISEFKTYAESYYSIGDDTQDKKLVRYSLQIINLCNIYQGQVENEGYTTQENFEEFKSKVLELGTKIEKQANGGDEVQTFVQSNFKKEYDFEGKDDLLNFINGENS